VTPRADFYILSGADLKQRDVYACRLIEKAFLAGLSVVVMTGEDSTARHFDDLLWTFNDRSFVPHQLCLAAATIDAETPIRVQSQFPPADAGMDLLLNLSVHVPSAAETPARIAMILDEDGERRRIGREHFRIYRERNFELQTHRIGASD
jgi:DNA polymerase III subunit chi